MEDLINSLLEARQGTLSGVILRKKGKERGRGQAKKRYGDDLVHVLVYTGFKYINLVWRSRDRLIEYTDADLKGLLPEGTMGWVKGEQVPVTLDHMKAAQAAMVASFDRTIDGTNTSTTDEVFEPLVQDGEVVRGVRVYVGHDDPTKNEEPPGTIYLQGLKVGETVLEEAPNGPIPASNSSPETVAKGLLRKTLPVGKYVSYSLRPGEDWILNLGGAAAVAADADGISADPAKVVEVHTLLAA